MLFRFILALAALGASVEGVIPGLKGGNYYGSPLFATGGGSCPAGYVSRGFCNVYNPYYPCAYGGTCNWGSRTCCASNFAVGGGQCLPNQCFSSFNCPPPYTTCQPSGFGLGRCCMGNLATQVCPNGGTSTGPCGAGGTCPAASTCIIGGSGLAQCCLNAATGDTCPAPTPNPWACFTYPCVPGQCPAGQRCCPNSCGRYQCTPIPVASGGAVVVPLAG